MNMPEILVSLVLTIFGSGGVAIWALNRYAKKVDRNDEKIKTLERINERLELLQSGLVMALENDRVIFKALRTHEINGESEDQEQKMDEYFISLLNRDGDKK